MPHSMSLNWTENELIVSISALTNYGEIESSFARSTYACVNSSVVRSNRIQVQFQPNACFGPYSTKGHKTRYQVDITETKEYGGILSRGISSQKYLSVPLLGRWDLDVLWILPLLIWLFIISGLAGYEVVLPFESGHILVSRCDYYGRLLCIRN